MSQSAAPNPQADADRLEAAADEAIAACGGNVRDALKALIVANEFLESEVCELMQAVSHAYARGTRAVVSWAESSISEGLNRSPNSCAKPTLVNGWRSPSTRTAPVSLVIPMLPLLEKVIEASPCGSLTFIETEFGKPHTTKGLGNWFADQCLLADVPGRAHGLRHDRGRERRDAVSAHVDLRLENARTGGTLHQEGPPAAHGRRVHALDRIRSDRERM